MATMLLVKTSRKSGDWPRRRGSAFPTDAEHHGESNWLFAVKRGERPSGDRLRDVRSGQPSSQALRRRYVRRPGPDRRRWPCRLTAPPRFPFPVAPVEGLGRMTARTHSSSPQARTTGAAGCEGRRGAAPPGQPGSGRRRRRRSRCAAATRRRRPAARPAAVSGRT